MRYSQISAFRALPCPALVFAQACQSLTAYGSCAHWARAPSRPKLRSAVAPSGLSSTLVRFAHPSGKKASIAHFAGGARNVARNLVGQITPTLMRAPVLAFFRRQNGQSTPFSRRVSAANCPEGKRGPSGALGAAQSDPQGGWETSRATGRELCDTGHPVLEDSP